MSVFTNTKWQIVGNGFHGTWNITEQGGDIYGDPVVGVIISGNAVSFTRNGQGFQQMWSGSAVPIGGSGGGVNTFYSIMGFFTHFQNGQQTGPFTWSGLSELVPG